MLCMSGSVVSFDEGGSDAWGVGMGMALNETGQSGDAPNAYDATAFGVVGFRFVLRGTVPPVLQINFTTSDGGTYCDPLYDVAGSELSVAVYFSSTEFECWGSFPGEPPDQTNLDALQIQVVFDDNETIDFDFCVEDLEAILE
jgi:hypothetical protein